MCMSIEEKESNGDSKPTTPKLSLRQTLHFIDIPINQDNDKQNYP